MLAFGSITLSGCYVNLGFIEIGTKPVTDDENHKDGKVIYDEEKDKQTIATYYSTIDGSQSGETLLTSLRELNLSKRTSTVGYNNMPGAYKYTDYDPAHVKWNSNGIPYAGQILSFYSGISVLSYDREHIWPYSRLTDTSGKRGDNDIENDIFMPRPTASIENQSRGNSPYVTGLNTEHDGWDPVTAFRRDPGVADGVRGECARIIFYSAMADGTLNINDSGLNDAGKIQSTMGSLSDLMEWMCENPVTLREKRRQIGGQYLQGNRNAFVDHPEYACKIWGSKTSRTKAACQKAGYSY